MDDIGRWMAIAGAMLLVAGVLVWAAAQLGLGRLPGDISFERGGFHFEFPLATSIVLSIVLTVVLNVVVRLWR